MQQPALIPGDDLRLFESDLLTLNGRCNALLELEQRKNLALRQAYSQLKEEFEAYKEAEKDRAIGRIGAKTK